MHRRLKFFLLSLLPVLVAPCAALAQQQGDDNAPWSQGSGSGPVQRTAPNFTPPSPPPNFTPPPPPQGVPPPRRVQPQQGPQNAPAREPQTSAQQPASPSPRAAAPSNLPELPDDVEEVLNDPGALASPNVNLDEPVGVIRIPELGANEVLEMLENLTQKSVLRQQNLPQVRITFFSQGELTRRQAITAIESLLALNGIAVTKLGDTFLKAVPLSTVNSQVPVLIDGSSLGLTPSQKVYSKVFYLNFLTTEEAAGAVSSFLTQGQPIAFGKNSAILITDSLVNIQRVENLLAKIDQPAPLNTEMAFFKLRNINAQDALRRLQTLQQGSLRARLEGNTTIDADERTNQLLVFTHPSNVKLISDIVEQLDMDVEPLTRTEIFSIRHADAVEVSEVIREVVTGQERVRDQQTGQRVRRPVTPAQQQAATTDGPGVQFSPYLTIVPDERTNTIVATGTASDLKLLNALVDRLDSLLPQVRIEVVIAEVQLAENDVSGLNQFGLSYGREAPGAFVEGGPDAAPYPIRGDGYDVPSGEGLGGGNKDLWLWPSLEGGGALISPFALEHFTFQALFQVAERNNRVQVLSAPTIVTTHNREASIIVGDQVPVVTSTTQGLEGSSYQTAQVQFRDVTLELNVKPLIGDNGIVQMEIEQKYDTLGEPRAIGGGVEPQPTISTRQATSFVSVRSGNLVVLGGLQRVDESDRSGKVFLLGDIPVLGELFRPKSRSIARTELLIFIRPVVVNNAEEANTDAERQIDRAEAAERIREYLESGHFNMKKEQDEAEAEKPKRILRRGQWVEVQ